MPREVALPAELTTPAPEPAKPVRNCRDDASKKTLCEKDTADWLLALRAWGRGLYKQLTEIAGRQPK